ncbi:hypothetical protein LLEC1_01162 [Akanthomyces lecanii]|uniref:Cyanovirin-N domain-containing protein n=1 Tax=Cordyceps confragosa TaxID=2714763 RepID=A0A179IAU1_CORDF|nr:hypothetical protein LLEC1_01162 [Akanthomyces lecanii]
MFNPTRGVLVLGSLFFAPVLAVNCSKGLSYCGTALISRGYDQQRLVDALEKTGQAGISSIINGSVYHCDDDSGNISFVTTCDVCKDGGAGHDDSCDTSKRANCDARFTYCGSTLTSRAGYSPQVESALRQASQPINSGFTSQSLFKCTGDASGTVEFLSYCGSCVDGGAGNSDSCADKSGSNCSSGIAYCGFNLLNKGGYHTRLSNALQSVFPDSAERDQKMGVSLFMCNGNGNVTALSTCNCLNGGSGANDYCASPSCKKGVNFCGTSLMQNSGNSAMLTLLAPGAQRSTLAAALSAAGQPTDNAHVENSVFTCQVDIQANKVKFLSFCGNNATQCINGGAASDHCQPTKCRFGIDYCGKTLLAKGKSNP